MVHDAERTEKTATATFTAVMTRNENAPRFREGEYRITITDRYTLGQDVIPVAATDADNVRSVSHIRNSVGKRSKRFRIRNPKTDQH